MRSLTSASHFRIVAGIVLPVQDFIAASMASVTGFGYCPILRTEVVTANRDFGSQMRQANCSGLRRLGRHPPEMGQIELGPFRQ